MAKVIALVFFVVLVALKWDGVEIPCWVYLLFGLVCAWEIAALTRGDKKQQPPTNGESNANQSNDHRV